MEGHFHHDAVSIVWITVAAIVGINILRLIAAQLVARGITAGEAIGALVR